MTASLLPTTIADHTLLAAIRAAGPDDTAILRLIAAARAEATVTIASLYTATQQKLLAEQSRNARLKVALDEVGRTVKGALAT